MVDSLYVGGKSYVSNGRNVSFKEPCIHIYIYISFEGTPFVGRFNRKTAKANNLGGLLQNTHTYMGLVLIKDPQWRTSEFAEGSCPSECEVVPCLNSEPYKRQHNFTNSLSLA